MNRDQFSHIAKLREFVASMERDLSLDRSGSDERSVICALPSAKTAAGRGSVLSTVLKACRLFRDMSKPVYRVLASLLQHMVIVKAK